MLLYLNKDMIKIINISKFYIMKSEYLCLGRREMCENILWKKVKNPFLKVSLVNSVQSMNLEI